MVFEDTGLLLGKEYAQEGRKWRVDLDDGLKSSRSRTRSAKYANSFRSKVYRKTWPPLTFQAWLYTDVGGYQVSTFQRLFAHVGKHEINRVN